MINAIKLWDDESCNNMTMKYQWVTSYLSSIFVTKVIQVLLISWLNILLVPTSM